MQTKELIEALNTMLAQEHACAIRYATHAAMVHGPYADVIAARLKEISGDEILHAEHLRERIVALGGKPSMKIAMDDLVEASSLKDILEINMKEEKAAIASYTKILEKVPQDNVILFQTIQEILRDEQEHLEELENLAA